MDNEYQDFIKYWSKARKVGMMKFMLTQGLIWGGLVCLVVRMLELTSYSIAAKYFSGAFLIDLLVFVAVGTIGVGYLMWQINERTYRRFRRDLYE